MTDFTGNIGVLHQKYWNLCVNEAKINNETMAFMPPDVYGLKIHLKVYINIYQKVKQFLSFLKCTAESFLKIQRMKIIHQKT